MKTMFQKENYSILAINRYSFLSQPQHVVHQLGV